MHVSQFVRSNSSERSAILIVGVSSSLLKTRNEFLIAFSNQERIPGLNLTAKYSDLRAPTYGTLELPG